MDAMHRQWSLRNEVRHSLLGKDNGTRNALQTIYGALLPTSLRVNNTIPTALDWDTLTVYGAGLMLGHDSAATSLVAAGVGATFAQLTRVLNVIFVLKLIMEAGKAVAAHRSRP